MTRLVIKTCPTCGSHRIRRVKRNITSKRGGGPYVARRVEIEECPDCGEQLFSPAALEQIAAQQPQGRKVATRRRTA